MVIVLDANVWVSSLSPTETHYVASDAWLASWMTDGRSIVVPELFLVEVAGTIARKRQDPSFGLAALRALRAHTSLRVVAVTQTTWAQSAEIAATHLLRGADAVYVALAVNEGLPLVTWDQMVLRNATAIVDVRTPDQMLI